MGRSKEQKNKTDRQTDRNTNIERISTTTTTTIYTVADPEIVGGMWSSRAAEGRDGVGCREGVWGGGCAHSQNFSILDLKTASFGALWG